MKPLGYSKDHEKITMSVYLPDFIADSVTGVDFRLLKKLGITHVFLDLDQTIRKRSSKILDQEIIHLLKSLKTKKQFKEICLLSNNNRNLERFSKPLGAKVFQPYRSGAKIIRKPNPVFFNKVLKELRVKPANAVMIGDKLRSDVAGGNKAGLMTVLVSPRGPDYWFDSIFLTRFREKRSLNIARLAVIKARPELHSTEAYITEALKQLNITATKIKKMDVDARGSEPYTVETSQNILFVKVYSRKHNIADWLFKSWRRLVFHRLEDEVPFMSPKQALEHEAFIAKHAFENGISTPKVSGLIDLGDYRFGLVTNYVEGKPLASLAKRKITPKLQNKIWKQVKKLHESRVAHRDLRASNILIDNKQTPWLIDFDFATMAATPKNIARDNLELLVSIATIVGAKDAVRYASTVLIPSDFMLMKKYMKIRYLSSQTRKAIYTKPKVFDELISFADVMSADKTSL